MRVIVPVLFLTIILALLSTRLQEFLRKALATRPVWMFVVPAALSAIFCAIAAGLGALSLPLAALVIGYTFPPTVYAFGVRDRAAPAWTDFLLILWLWLPIEFAAGAAWVPKPAQGLLHMAAYGVSVTLGLVLFLLVRRLEGMKYQLPRRARDLKNALIGYAVIAPILIPLGLALGFLQPFHLPAHASAGRLAAEFLFIFCGTALPEEILFRALIQNALMRKLGENLGTLFLAAVIFGCAHLDNGPQALPNWRYMILATIAGFAYGKVFQSSSSIFASALLHTFTDASKHWFF